MRQADRHMNSINRYVLDRIKQSVFLFCFQEKNFLQMVVEAGTPGIQKQIVKPQNLKSMEARYEETLQELANVIKVPSQTHSLNVEIERFLYY